MYCHHIRCQRLEPQYHFNFQEGAKITVLLKKCFDSYQLEILASITEIDDLILAAWAPSERVSSKRTRRTIEVDPRLADLFKSNGLGVVHAAFSFADMIAFESLIHAYGLNEAFKAPTRAHKELALDICQWIVEQTEPIRWIVLKGQGEAAWEALPQNDRKKVYR